MENNEDKDLEPQGGAVEQESSSPQQDHMTSSEKDDEMKSDSEENSATRGNSESNPSSPQEEITDQPNIPKPDDPHSPIVSHISSSNRTVKPAVQNGLLKWPFKLVRSNWTVELDCQSGRSLAAIAGGFETAKLDGQIGLPISSFKL